MKIFRDPTEITNELPNPVVTIGNFDGVHLGHLEIFRRLGRDAAQLGGVSVVVTFEPHPLKVLQAGKDIRLITTYHEKELLIEKSGIDCLVVVPFTTEFASVSAEAFVRDLLLKRIGARKLIIGYDYAFGRNREGDVRFLQRMGAQLGFTVETLGPIGCGETVYSSSSVRRLVANGNVANVPQILGRHFSLEGLVIHGCHRGKTLGFPTANIRTDKELIPLSGVYAVKIEIDGVVRDGACNIGTNPTFAGKESSIEVFVFDLDENLYGKEVKVYFVERVREERTFANIDALRHAITEDVAGCRRILRGVSLQGEQVNREQTGTTTG